MSSDRAHADHTHEHPTWKQYKWVALWLTLITAAEVWAYYVPAFVASKAFVPVLLIMSAVKFTVVVMFYMHLKNDTKILSWLFAFSLLIAIVVIFALFVLFTYNRTLWWPGGVWK